MKIVLLGLNHELQWKDPTGDLQKVLNDHLARVQVDLVAEEACNLPTTVGQRLSCKLNKPWLDMDMSTADRKLAGIYDELTGRPSAPVFGGLGYSEDYSLAYLPRADGVRETEWTRRLLRHTFDLCLCLCGFMHLDPFAKKLEERDCEVEKVDLTQLDWFQQLYGIYRIVEANGQRWCEIRQLKP